MKKLHNLPFVKDMADERECPPKETGHCGWALQSKGFSKDFRFRIKKSEEENDEKVWKEAQNAHF